VNVKDALAVGLNLIHAKLLNAFAVLDMKLFCCSFHTNSSKIHQNKHRPPPAEAAQVSLAACHVKIAITAEQ
jgi:hypothetical protein